MKQLISFIIAAAFCLSADAQAVSCPTVRVSCPDETQEEQALTFTAMVNGGDNNVSPTYNWTVSAGFIESGGGTSSVSVNTKGLGGQTVTATVEVGGYDRSCRTSNSCTTGITPAPKPEKEIPVTKKKSPAKKKTPAKKKG